jgi:periplasmic divalent cation tolerance protein
MPETDVFFVYVTVPDEALARSIAAEAVTRRLAAGANILPAGRSVYRWQGEVEETAETVLVLKTAADRVEALRALVRACHPYELPCIAAWPVEAAADYRGWVVAGTREGG